MEFAEPPHFTLEERASIGEGSILAQRIRHDDSDRGVTLRALRCICARRVPIARPALDVLECATCHGRMKPLAMVTARKSVARYLAKIGEATDVPGRKKDSPNGAGAKR